MSGHIDENINGTYCQICKKNIAMPVAIFDNTFVCQNCIRGAAKLFEPYEVKEDIMSDNGKKEGE